MWSKKLLLLAIQTINSNTPTYTQMQVPERELNNALDGHNFYTSAERIAKLDKEWNE